MGITSFASVIIACAADRPPLPDPRRRSQPRPRLDLDLLDRPVSAPEQPAEHLLHLRRIPTGEILRGPADPRSGNPLVCQDTTQLTGYGVGRIDERDVAAAQLLDLSAQKWVVRAAQHNDIDAAV